MRYAFVCFYLFMACACVPTLPDNGANNSNSSGQTVPSGGCGGIFGPSSNGGGGNSGGGSNNGNGDSVDITTMVSSTAPSPIPFCSYGNLNSYIPAGTTYIVLPKSTDTLFIWESQSQSADFVSSVTNSRIPVSGDTFEFLADSVAGADASGNQVSYGVVRAEGGGYRLTLADQGSFLSSFNYLCLNFDLYGNAFNEFAADKVSYIAFRVNAGGTYNNNNAGYYYGWIKLLINNFKIQVYQIGVNSNLNQPIYMGQMQ